ncbi:MAG TPA: peptidylprolyl isomerase, partial [Dehalococcoidia bacterium]
GVTVDYQAMKRRMRFEYFQSAVYQQNYQILPEATYLNLLNEVTLVKRAASDLGVTATDEEISEALRKRIGVAPEADEKTFGDRYRTTLESSGLHDNEYRRLVTAEVLQEKVKDKFRTEAPPNVLEARLEVIAVDDEAAANAAIARIKAGEDFATVAKQVSNETDVQTTGGVKDFAPQGSFNTVYDDFAFDANIGDLSAPLSGTGSTFYVVRVIDRQDKPLTEEQKPAYVNRKYGDWLANTQANMNVKRDWEVQAQTDALIAVLKSLPAPSSQPQPNQVNPLQPEQQPPVEDGGAQPPAPDAGVPDAGAGNQPAPDAPPDGQ